MTKQCHITDEKSFIDDIFLTNNKHYLFILDYQSKFTVMKQVEGLTADNLIKHVRLYLQSMVSIQTQFQIQAQACLSEA